MCQIVEVFVVGHIMREPYVVHLDGNAKSHLNLELTYQDLQDDIIAKICGSNISCNISKEVISYGLVLQSSY